MGPQASLVVAGTELRLSPIVTRYVGPRSTDALPNCVSA